LDKYEEDLKSLKSLTRFPLFNYCLGSDILVILILEVHLKSAQCSCLINRGFEEISSDSVMELFLFYFLIDLE